MYATFTVLFFFLFSFSAYAYLPAEIELEADHIGYYKSKDILSASSNVSLLYRDYQVNSDFLDFDTQAKTLHFPHAVRFYNGEELLVFNDFFYDFVGYSGAAKHLEARFSGMTLKSDRVNFLDKKVILNNSQFSTCSADNPHHFVQSEEVELYPKEGHFVARKSYLNFKYLPFRIPIPYYAYGANQDDLIGSGSLLPQFGSNEVEGSYAKYKSSFLVNESLSGTTEIAYSSNLEWGLGFGGLWTFNSKLHSGARYNYFFDEAISSVYFVNRYRHVFDEDEQSSTGVLQDFSNVDSDDSYIELSFIYEENSIINDYWVSRKPELSLILSALTYADFTLDSSISLSDLTEKKGAYQFSDREFNSRQKLLYTYKLRPTLTLSTSVEYNAYLYEDSGQWTRLYNTYSLTYFGFLNPSVSYIKQMQNQGQSPFEFESLYAQSSDEFALSLSERFNRFKFSQTMYYNIQEAEFRNADITVDFLFHCWSVGFRAVYKPNLFELRFSL